MYKPRKRVLVAVGLEQAHFRAILRGAAAHALEQRLGWQLMDDWGVPSASRLDSVDGALLQVGSAPLRKALRRARIPWINLSAHEAPSEKEISVLPDNRAIGRAASVHFRDRGFRAFAFLGSAEHFYSIERLAGFREGLGDLPCLCLDRPGLTLAARLRWLLTLPHGCALFCANDIFARAAVRNLRESGRSVPEDVAVLGVDNDATVQALCEIPLSSVDPRSEGIGRGAARLLAALMEGKRVSPVTLVAPAGIVTRQSTDILMIPDEKVADAVALIREQASGSLEVTELVRRSGICRRALERRFTRSLGRGIGEEIRRVRIERGMELLDRSDLPVTEIAELAGFQDVYYFSAAFRRHTGQSPSGWRKQ